MWIGICPTKSYFLAINNRLRNFKFWNCFCPGTANNAWMYLHLVQYHWKNVLQRVRNYSRNFWKLLKTSSFLERFKGWNYTKNEFSCKHWFGNLRNTLLISIKWTHRNVLYQWQYTFLEIIVPHDFTRASKQQSKFLPAYSVKCKTASNLLEIYSTRSKITWN